MKIFSLVLLSILLFTSNSFSQEFQSYLSKGDSCVNNREFQEAVFLYKKAINLKPEKLITEDTAVIVFYSLGAAYSGLAEYQNALKYYFMYLEKEVVSKNNSLKGEAYNSIGNCYGYLNKYDLSLKFFKKALAIVDKDSSSIARMYNNVADTYLQQKKVEQAKINFEKALAYISGTKDSIGMLVISINLGRIALDENRIENAQMYIEKANSIAEAKKDTIFLIITKVYLADFYIKIRSFKEAEDNLFWALKYAKEKKHPDFLMEAYKSFIMLYKAQDKYKEAFRYLNEYKISSDSIFNENTNAEYENLEVKYTMREKEKETELLKKEKNLTELKVNAQEKYIWVLAILFVLVTAFLMLVVFQRQRRAKAKSELEQKNKEIIKSQKQLQDLNRQYEKLIERYEGNEPNKPNVELS